MLFRKSKVQVLQPRQPGSDDAQVPHAGKESYASVNVKVSRFLLFLMRTRSGPNRQYRYAGDDEMMAPLSKVVEIPQAPMESAKPQPPPLPYRLTFKNRKDSTNAWSGHKTVEFQLGFNAVTIAIKVESFFSGLRRVYVNNEEVVCDKVKEGGKEWSFSHFFSDQNSYNPSHKRLGTILKVVVTSDQTISLFADGFPVECLRRSSVLEKGSPPPPAPVAEVETLDLTELDQICRI